MLLPGSSPQPRFGRSLQGLEFACLPRSFAGHDVCCEIDARDWVGIRPLGLAVNRFPYLRDRLFLAATVSYGLNRWLIKPLSLSPFMHGQFNDLLLIPAALPVVLWIQRRTGLRTQDGFPSWSDISLHLLVWSVICEFIGPVCLHRGTADLSDVAAYTIGGVASGIWWNHRARTVPKATS